MKSTPYMKGLLYAEEERQRLERKNLNKTEIYHHLTNLYMQEDLYWNTTHWLQGFNDYRNAYLKGEIV